jgi:RNA polymerase sigma-70 factor, ECF subfamily
MSDMPRPIALAGGRMEATERAALSTSENPLVGLFDELRIPLLRYLHYFPLRMQDAEDVVQEAFLSLHQQLRRGRSIEEVRGWLFRAAHNLALKKLLRSRKNPESNGTPDGAEIAIVDPALNPEERLSSQQIQRRVQNVVRALPEQDRWCLYLRVEGLRYRQIAEILNISLGSVSNSLQRSLVRIERATEW